MGNPQLDAWDHATQGNPDTKKRLKILEKIDVEVVRSYELHGCPRWGRHEAFAIILEELEEAKQAIFDDEPYERVMKELIQTASMCVRYLETEPRFDI